MTGVPGPDDQPPQGSTPLQRSAASSVLERLLVIGLVSIPFVVLVVVLSRRGWHPTGDLAYAELRLRSMPRHIPLLGTAGRIADEAGRQGNHPGPLMFWAMWPFYVVFGRTAWAFETAAMAVNLLWTAMAIWLAGLRLRLGALLGLGATVLVLLRAFGLDAMSQPWNPWMALYPFLALLFATWATYLRVRWAPIVAVIAGSFAVQCHIGYLPVVLPLVIAALLGPVVLARRDGEAGGPTPAVRAGAYTTVGIAMLAGVVAWAGPLIDFLTAEHHNVGKLIHNFGSPDEPPVGLLTGLETVVRTLNPFADRGSGTTVVTASPLGGLLFLAAWATSALLVARLRLDRRLDVLNVTLAVTTVLTAAAVSRIFGQLYLYVYRWIEVLLALQVLAVVWGVVVLLRHRLADDRVEPTRAGAHSRVDGGGSDVVAPMTRRLTAMAVGVVAVLAVTTSVTVAGQEIPYDYTWRSQAALADAAADALDPGVHYLVRFDDPLYLTGPGFGLFLELERRGFDVGAPEHLRAAVEPHRVRCEADADRILTVVVGSSRIASWRTDPEATEVAETRLRADGVYEAQLKRLRAALEADGRSVPLDEVEAQVYDIFFFSRHAQSVIDEAEALLEAGAPTAVFESEPNPSAPSCG